MTARRAFLKWLGAVPAATTLLAGPSRAALVDSGRGHVRLEDARIGLHFDDALRCRIVGKAGARTQALTRFDACGVALKGRRPVDRFTLVSAEPHAGQTPFGAGQSLRLVGRSREGLVKEMTITLLDAFPGTALVDVAYANRGQAALEDCNKALQSEPADAATFDSRGLIYMKMGLFDKAIDDYNSALRLDPKLASALYGRGLAKRKKGDKVGSDADMSAA